MRHASPCGRAARLRPALLAAGLAVLASVAARAGGPAPAGPPRFGSGPLTVERPWSRATPGGSTVAAGYLTLRNDGDAPDRLVSVSTDAAGRAVPHSMVEAGGVMVMRPLAQGILIPPHATVSLAPGGDHLMLEDLRRPLREGGSFAATLVFERAGPVAVTFTVEAIGARAPAGTATPARVPAAGMKM